MSELPDFNLQIQRAKDATTLCVTGELDIGTVNQLQRGLEKAVGGDPHRVVIDLRDVSFIDSTGLKFLLDTHWRSQTDSWTLELLRPAETAMKVFYITGADKHLPFVDPAETWSA
jgi:anti-anti-sigma factor